MLRARVFILAAMGVAAIVRAFAANAGDQPLNDLPDGGYKVTNRDWAKPPGGVPWDSREISSERREKRGRGKQKSAMLQ